MSKVCVHIFFLKQQNIASYTHQPLRTPLLEKSESGW